MPLIFISNKYVQYQYSIITGIRLKKTAQNEEDHVYLEIQQARFINAWTVNMSTLYWTYGFAGKNKNDRCKQWLTMASNLAVFDVQDVQLPADYYVTSIGEYNIIIIMLMDN